MDNIRRCGFSASFVERFIYKDFPCGYKEIGRFKMPRLSFSESLVRATADSSSAIITVCAGVILCSAFLGVISVFPWKISAGVTALTEVTSACSLLTQSGAPLKVLTFVISFGGLSVHFQILALSSEYGIKFLIIRIVNGIACALTVDIISKIFPQSMSVMAVNIRPVPGYSVSPLASASLLITCFILLCSLKFGKEKISNEKFKVFLTSILQTVNCAKNGYPLKAEKRAVPKREAPSKKKDVKNLFTTP